MTTSTPHGNTKVKVQRSWSFQYNDKGVSIIQEPQHWWVDIPELISARELGQFFIQTAKENYPERYRIMKLLDLI